MGSKGYLYGEVLAGDIQRATERQAANTELRKAESYHAGTLAQLAAALRELERLDPGNPMHYQQVLDVIDAEGERCFHRTKRFADIWDLRPDPAGILAHLQAEHEKSRTTVLDQIESETLLRRTTRFLWFKEKTHFVFAGTKFPTPEAAAAVKKRMTEAARGARLGESLDFATLKARCH